SRRRISRAAAPLRRARSARRRGGRARRVRCSLLPPARAGPALLRTPARRVLGGAATRPRLPVFQFVVDHHALLARGGDASLPGILGAGSPRPRPLSPAAQRAA